MAEMAEVVDRDAAAIDACLTPHPPTPPLPHCEAFRAAAEGVGEPQGHGKFRSLS